MSSIRVFISHKQEDHLEARRIAARLSQAHGIEYYLDVVDDYINDNADNLAAHIRVQMGQCTQLIAVISKITQISWWVPWEIGVATEKDFPLATYSADRSIPPEYLRKWPYLIDMAGVDSYAMASKKVAPVYDSIRGYAAESASILRANATSEFYKDLRRRLGQ